MINYTCSRTVVSYRIDFFKAYQRSGFCHYLCFLCLNFHNIIHSGDTQTESNVVQNIFY